MYLQSRVYTFLLALNTQTKHQLYIRPFATFTAAIVSEELGEVGGIYLVTIYTFTVRSQ